ncbi:hypothetical protein [Bacillus subtilis]|uniref:hypothetical protein n=1 Tax=Bacillus subtilis TaxID=1423 RepID=UPI00190F119E|nr:hypothetical protein [Bacillus subtilis]
MSDGGGQGGGRAIPIAECVGNIVSDTFNSASPTSVDSAGMPFPQIGQAPIEDKWLAEMKGCGTIR